MNYEPQREFKRRDAADKVRGRTRYMIDGKTEGTLHAVLLRASIAAGRVLRLDVSVAAAMPGVKAIVTAQDAPGWHGTGIADQQLFAGTRIRHFGEPLAAIAATSLAAARRARDAIIVEVEPLTAAITMEQALESNAPLVHPDWQGYEVLREGSSRSGNIAWEAIVERGDVDDAFSRDDVEIIETNYRVNRQNHVALEPRGATAVFCDGRFEIETTTQNPWLVRRCISEFLCVPSHQVRVTVPPVGGAFGLKYDVAVEPFVALLARKSGLPVRMVLTRDEEMQFCLFRENADIRIRSAVTREGRIVGREAVVLMDCGAYGGEQVFLTTMTAHTLGGNYQLETVRIVSRAIYTNTPPNGAFRACNGVYNTFALENHTNEICRRLGMDPLDFRRRNVLGDGDIGATGQVFEGDVLVPMLDRMAAMRPENPVSAADPTGHRLYGRATVLGTWFVLVGPSQANVQLHKDGTATLVTTGVEIGSGSMQQALPQIVAAELGLRPQDVIVRPADTDAAGHDLGVGGGRTTVSLGAASRKAAVSVRDQVFETAALLLQTEKNNLVLRDGRVEIRTRPGSGMTLAAITSHIEETSGPISGTGSFTKPGALAMAGCARGHFLDAIDIPVFVVNECDVAVDRDTGHVEILRYAIVQDVGRAINPSAVQGQIQGGVVQGLGYALHEQISITPEGKITECGLDMYHVPLAEDVLPVDIFLYEGAPSIGPYGAKGAGEAPILAVPAAVSCAISNALGMAMHELPMTPPNVLARMNGNLCEPVFPHIHPEWRMNTLEPKESRNQGSHGKISNR